MQVSYGPPGHKGVTTLMAVGADDYSDPAVQRVTEIGELAALGALAAGLVTGHRGLTSAGIGAGLVLLALRATRRPRVVPVTMAAGQW